MRLSSPRQIVIIFYLQNCMQNFKGFDIIKRGGPLNESLNNF